MTNRTCTTTMLLMTLLSLSTRCYAEPGISVTAYKGMTESLSFVVDNTQVSLWRCDYVANQIERLRVKVSVVKDHGVRTMGEVVISTESGRGTIFLPLASAREVDPTRQSIEFLSVGIAAEAVQRSTPLDLKFGKDFKLSNTYSPLVTNNHRIPKESHEVLWIFTFVPSNSASPAGMPLDKILNSSPRFSSTQLQDVVSATKELKNTVTVILSAHPE